MRKLTNYIFLMLLVASGAMGFAQDPCENDAIAPVMILHRNIHVALGIDGFAYLCADQVDNGSNDNCTDIGLRIRKDDQGAGAYYENMSANDNCVLFDCSNISSQTVVWVRGWDDANGDGLPGPHEDINGDGVIDENDGNGDNWNETWARITIEDKTAPVVVCESNIVLQLSSNFDAVLFPSSVDGGTFDNCNFSLSLNKTYFTNADIGMNHVELTATDDSGNSSYCWTEVEVRRYICTEDTTDFVIDPWPSDITIDVNSFSDVLDWDEPEELVVYNTYDAVQDTGKVYDAPILHYDCEVVAHAYHDEVFQSTDHLRIVRTWDVIQWDAVPEPFLQSEEQVIQINISNDDCADDILAPIAVCNSSIALQLGPDFTAELRPEDVDGGSWDNCNFTLSISQTTFTNEDIGTNTVVLTVTDDAGNSSQCWTEVIVRRYICADDQTDFVINPWPSDITITSSRSALFDLIQPDELSVYNTYDSDTGTGEVYDRPVLHYDCEVPGVAYADTYISVSPDIVKILRDWTVVEWLSGDAFNGVQVITVNISPDNCSEDFIPPIAICEANLTVSLGLNGEAYIRAEDVDAGSYDDCGEVTLSLSQNLFTVNDIGTNRVILTVTDEAGNYNECWTEVSVRGFRNDRIRVCIHDPWGRAVTDVEVIEDVYTNNSGCVFINRGDELILEKQDLMNNGVTSLDAALLQEHILAIRQLDPDVLLAADISEDGYVSSLDLIELNNIILNSYTGSCPPWKFFNNTDPSTFQGSTMDILGVKMGDLNGSYSGNRATGNVLKEKYDVIVEDEILNAGVSYSIPFNVEVQSTEMRMEYIFGYDPARIEIIGVSNSMTTDEAVLLDYSEGVARIMVTGEVRTDLNIFEEAALFHLELRSLVNGTLKEELDTDSYEARTELIWAGSSDSPYFLEIDWDGVLLDVPDVNAKDDLARLFPNPVSDYWTIEIPSDEVVQFSLKDIHGRTLIEEELSSSKQYSRTGLIDGVYFYTFKNENGIHQSGRVLIAN